VTARPYSTIAKGERFTGALTVTETHVVLAAGIFNDPGPNHVNALQAERGRFGARIAHGPLILGIADGVLGNAIGATIVALLDQTARFRRPAFLGDTLVIEWTVTERTDKPAFGGGGIVGFDGRVRNQDGGVLVELETHLAVGEEAPWSPEGVGDT